MYKLWIAIIAVLIVALAAWQYRDAPWLAPLLGSSEGGQPVSKVHYTCGGDKTIAATFYTDKVALVFGNGRKATLPQTISASGIRYATKDESLVFWSKGNTAFVTEGPSQEQTYTDCISANGTEGDVTGTIYASSTLGFSVRYPQSYIVDTSYIYEALGPDSQISGVKFIVGTSSTSGTNLSRDSGVSIEQLPDGKACSVTSFLSPKPQKAMSISENDTHYTVASSTGAGAGNLYEETVYVVMGSSPCTVVRYFIHSSNIANYPSGTVLPFNKEALLSEFDSIRKSLVLTH